MKLHDYQVRAAQHVAAHRRTVLSVGMGLGKTAAVLHAVASLAPATLLVVAPKRVAETVWRQEAEKWGLTEVADKMVVVKGTKAQRRRAWDDDSRPYKVVGRDNLGDLFTDKAHPTQADRRFEMVVLDELTSFKSVTSKRTIHAAVLAADAERCTGLTGTFLANGAVDVYGQMAAVGLASWRYADYRRWLYSNFEDVMAGSGLKWHKWRPLVKLPDLLRRWRESIFTLDSKDWLDIPEVETVRHAVELSAEERNRYDTLEAFLGADFGDGEVVTVDEAAKFAKLQTMCDGFVYTGGDMGGDGFYKDVVRGEHSTKLEAVAEFCRQAVAESESVLLFYAFRAEQAWLKELMPDLEVIDVRDKGALERWTSGDFVGVMTAHPASAGHGLNLQGGGRILVWSTLTYNYEYYAQANARLARQGQRRAVKIHVFTAADTCEEGKAKALARKDKEQNEFLELTKVRPHTCVGG